MHRLQTTKRVPVSNYDLYLGTKAGWYKCNSRWYRLFLSSTREAGIGPDSLPALSAAG